MKSNKKYTEEFKLKVINIYKAGTTVKQLNEDYKISNATIYKWIKDISLNQVDGCQCSKQKEYKKMKERIQQLEQENETMKKAIAIFVKYY